MHALLAHDWPGNVRELVNRVQRATVMAEGRFIQPEDLGLDRYTEPARVMSLEEARAVAESEVIRRALSQSRNQISRAAALLGVSRVTLYRLIDKYKIRTDASPSASPALPSTEWGAESVDSEEDDVSGNDDGERWSQVD
jgi:DNA-binding NtrC family response regulator